MTPMISPNSNKFNSLSLNFEKGAFSRAAQTPKNKEDPFMKIAILQDEIEKLR